MKYKYIKLTKSDTITDGDEIYISPRWMLIVNPMLLGKLYGKVYFFLGQDELIARRRVKAKLKLG